LLLVVHTFSKKWKIAIFLEFFFIFYHFFIFFITFHHFCFQWCKNFQKNGKLQFSSFFSFFSLFYHFCFQCC
jgi:hypothetical protein